MNQEKIWDKISSSWGEYRDKPFSEVIEFLKNTKGNYLDIGCGSGRNFLELSEAKCFGIDFSEGMLKLAEKRAREKIFE